MKTDGEITMIVTDTPPNYASKMPTSAQYTVKNEIGLTKYQQTILFEFSLGIQKLQKDCNAKELFVMSHVLCEIRNS